MGLGSRYPARAPSVQATLTYTTAMPAPQGDEWVILDVETTGLSPRTDRIVEVGVIRVTANGDELDAWTTLINPDRDMGPVHIHGIAARDVLDAPRFRDVAPDLLAHLGGAHLAAHNAMFDLGFVGAEFARLGFDWGPPEALCTMSTPFGLGVVHSRALQDCCHELGIPYDHGHTALHDARAASRVLLITLARAGARFPYPVLTPQWPSREPPGMIAVRGALRSLPQRSALAAMAAQLGVPDGVTTPEDVALSYLALLDRVIEDRQITEEEVAALAEFANAWGIDRGDADELHDSYLDALSRRAWADGTLTDAEHRDLETVAELLGVALEAGATPPLAQRARSTPAMDMVTGVRPQNELAGQSVCFTGESVCTLGGSPLSREDQQSLAVWAGLTVKSGVSGKLDLLVLADPDSQSGKARKAVELGVRRVAEPVFWRLAGVPID